MHCMAAAGTQAFFMHLASRAAATCRSPCDNAPLEKVRRYPCTAAAAGKPTEDRKPSWYAAMARAPSSAAYVIFWCSSGQGQGSRACPSFASSPCSSADTAPSSGPSAQNPCLVSAAWVWVRLKLGAQVHLFWPDEH